jgi:hypothetical protein
VRRPLAALAADPATPPLVLVTHHVEEIPPGFTHALLLGRDGVHAAGPIEDVLRDDGLSMQPDASADLIVLMVEIWPIIILIGMIDEITAIRVHVVSPPVSCRGPFWRNMVN